MPFAMLCIYETDDGPRDNAAGEFIFDGVWERNLIL